MARKEDKLRPYRVDYFNMYEMDADRALVKSVVVRAVTAVQAANIVLFDNDAEHADDRIIIRSHRFYKKLTHKRDVRKPVEDLFSANEAIKVMTTVEAWRRKRIDSQFEAAACPYGYTKENPGTAHTCAVHSAADYQPCGTAELQARTGGVDPDASGPNSPATKAVMADLQGMTDHDAHEQTMDTFVPDAPLPDKARGLGFPNFPVIPTKPAMFDDHVIDLDTAAPVIHPAPEHGDEISYALTAVAINDPMPGTPTFLPPPPPNRYLNRDAKWSLGMKIGLFVAITATVVFFTLLVLNVPHCGR